MYFIGPPPRSFHQNIDTCDVLNYTVSRTRPPGRTIRHGALSMNGGILLLMLLPRLKVEKTDAANIVLR